MRQPTIIQFINYQPRIYSSFDKFTIALSCHLKTNGYQSVFVFYNNLSNIPQLKKDIEKAGIKIELLDDSLSTPLFFVQVCKLFIRYRPKLVHIHFDDMSKIIIATCCTLLGVPLINSVHSEISPHALNNYRQKKGILKFILLKGYLNLLKWSSRYCLCVSQKIHQQYTAFTGISNKIQIIYLGVKGPETTKNSVTVRSELNLSSSDLLICNVSAIEFIKGLDIIMESINILKLKYGFESFAFYHVGGLRNSNRTSEYLNELKKSISDKGLENHFKFMGLRNDVIEILPAFDIYIQPSREEGLGMSLMEACAVGLPCIGTEVGGIPEIVHDKFNGFVIDSDSPNQLASKLAHLMTDSKLRSKMGQNSRSIFSKYFELDGQVKKILNIYSHIIPL